MEAGAITVRVKRMIYSHVIYIKMRGTIEGAIA
jgi:hypothetical protein